MSKVSTAIKEATIFSAVGYGLTALLTNGDPIKGAVCFCSTSIISKLTKPIFEVIYPEPKSLPEALRSFCEFPVVPATNIIAGYIVGSLTTGLVKAAALKIMSISAANPVAAGVALTALVATVLLTGKETAAAN